MKTRRDYLRLLIFLLTSVLAEPALAGQAMQTINIATSAAGQSGYIAALIENKKLDVKHGIKIGNFARVTGAYFFSAVIAKEQKLDIEKDFQNVPAETGALIALLERGEVEAINMFEPHTTRLVMSGKYRVLVDFDIELEQIFGAPPLKSTVGMLKETVEKQPALVKAIRSAYGDAIQVIKAGQDEEFFKSKAKELFNLST